MGLRRLVFDHFRFPISPVGFARRHRRVLRKLGGLGPVKLITRPIMAANTFSCIPVGESVEVPPGMAAPVSIVESFIAQASHRVIVNHCFCRNSSGCTGHEGGKRARKMRLPTCGAPWTTAWCPASGRPGWTPAPSG